MITLSFDTYGIGLISLVLVVWASLLFGGFFFGTYSAEENQRMPRWTRMGSSLSLVMIGWFLFLLTADSVFSQLTRWLAIGMTLGFIGDLFMAQVFPVKDYVLGGMASFGLGHIAYMIGMGLIANRLNLIFPRWDVLLVWWIIALVGWFIVVYFRSQPTILHYAALPYSILLASTAGVATGLSFEEGSFFLIAIGAGLFLLSDLILAADLFERVHVPLIGDYVWLTYGSGQMLIVCGIFLINLLG